VGVPEKHADEGGEALFSVDTTVFAAAFDDAIATRLNE